MTSAIATADGPRRLTTAELSAVASKIMDGPRHKVSASTSGARAPRHSYSAADYGSGNINWSPSLKSADGDIMWDAPRVRARARDLERNHPYAHQAVYISRLGVIGRKLRYSCRPDWRFLGIDQEAAIKWAQMFERVWENYAHGKEFYIDAGRRMDFTRLMALVHDRDFVDGECVITSEWDENRPTRTCFQAVDVDRLSNPNGQPESVFLKGGVLLDRLSAAQGYFIRDGHPADIGIVGNRNWTWSFVRRETDWGRPICMHSFDQHRAGQTRGISAYAPVINAMKQSAEYVEATLQSAILANSYAAVLTSTQNYKDALAAIGEMTAGDDAPSVLALAEENLEAAITHHEAIKLRFNGSKIPLLWPGEELKIIQPSNGANKLGEFQSHSTKSFAAGTGTDSVAMSQDYSQVNYSSGKLQAAQVYRGYEMRRDRLIGQNAMPMVASFLEEKVHSGAIPLPKGLHIADFYAMQGALINGVFLTQGAPIMDEMKTRQAQNMGFSSGIDNLRDAAGEEGKDWLELLDEQARENFERTQRGLAPVGAMPPPPPMPPDPAKDDQDTETEADGADDSEPEKAN